MSTPVQKVYRRFLSRIGKDLLTEIEDIQVAESIMLIYLEDGISYVENHFKDSDLSIVNDEINCDLTSNDIRILADAMLLYWLQPQINTQEMLKMSVTDSDYTKKNTASLLDKLRCLRTDAEESLRKSLVSKSWKDKVLE